MDKENEIEKCKNDVEKYKEWVRECRSEMRSKRMFVSGMGKTMLISGVIALALVLLPEVALASTLLAGGEAAAKGIAALVMCGMYISGGLFGTITAYIERADEREYLRKAKKELKEAKKELKEAKRNAKINAAKAKGKLEEKGAQFTDVNNESDFRGNLVVTADKLNPEASGRGGNVDKGKEEIEPGY